MVTGSVVALLFAYVVRFLSVSLQTLEASLAKIPASLDDAARSLGASVGGTLGRIHLPLMRGGSRSRPGHEPRNPSGPTPPPPPSRPRDAVLAHRARPPTRTRRNEMLCFRS